MDSTAAGRGRPCLRARLARLLHDDSGAVTVDFVVVAAAVVGLGIAALAIIADGALSMADDFNDSFSLPEISYDPPPG